MCSESVLCTNSSNYQVLSCFVDFKLYMSRYSVASSNLARVNKSFAEMIWTKQYELIHFSNSLSRGIISYISQLDIRYTVCNILVFFIFQHLIKRENKVTMFHETQNFLFFMFVFLI
jgi:hypothetical protein